MDREPKDFSERLRWAREAAGLTQTAAARAVDANPNQWSNWERDIAKPFVEKLGPISELLGVSIHWLVLGEGPFSAVALRVAEAAAEHSVSAQAVADAVARLSADELQRLADKRRSEEDTAWNRPLHEAIIALESALGNNPPLAVRDEITRTLERMRERMNSGETPRVQSFIYHAPPVQKADHTEEIEVQYEAAKAPPPSDSRRGKKEKGA